VYWIIITAKSGDLVRSVMVTLIVKPAPDFQLNVTPPSNEVIAGKDTFYLVALKSNETFKDVVALTTVIQPPVPGLIRCNPAPPALSDDGSGKLFIETEVSAPPGEYLITITGTCGNLVRSVTVTLIVKPVPGFELQIYKQTQTIKAGQTARYKISIIPIGGFADMVTLSPSGLDMLAGISVPFEPSNKILPNQTSELVITTSASTPYGTYPFKVLGNSQTQEHEISATLIIEPDNSVTPNPFTPNGDGFNDIVIFNIPGLRENYGKVEIYNFRGRKVRELSGQNQWDGKDDEGEELPLGPYIYIVKVDGNVKANGTLTLIR
jgi:gliding motility-associated-like protein